jgi:TolB protein
MRFVAISLVAAMSGCFCAGVCAALSVEKAIQVTHGNISDPSFSPDGKRMVVIATVEGREQLSTMDVDGSHEIRLTTAPFDHEDPAWSPDGKHIAYVSLENGGEVIHLMNVDGSNDLALTPSSQKTIHPSWSKDSSRIIYCTDDDLKPPKKNTSEIYVIDVASKKITSLISGGTNTYPSWSPDEQHIAFRKMIGETNSEVFVSKSDGSGEINLTNDPAFDGWPAWSPDGRQIAFASNRRGKNQEIYVMKSDGTEPRLVAYTDGRATAPKWSIDGGKVYFSVCRGRELGCEIFAGPVP